VKRPSGSRDVASELEDRRWSFRRDGEDLSRYVAALGQPPGQFGHRAAALRLGQDDAVRVAGEDRGKIFLALVTVERIDPHPQFGGAVGIEERRHVSPSFGLGRSGDRVLQIEDQGVGTGVERLFHPVGPVARNEKQGAQPHPVIPPLIPSFPRKRESMQR
jgi:hypothetical protein